jgi:Fe2+ or Zn2+ uptake regulation protein
VKADFDPKLAQDMGIINRLALARWSRRISAGAFRHEGGEHPDLNCMSCHNVATFNTLDLKTLKVAVRSCGGAEGCHITATTDDGGALNFEIDQKKKDPAFVCTKCHITFGREALPQGHPHAIPTPAARKPGS